MLDGLRSGTRPRSDPILVAQDLPITNEIVAALSAGLRVIATARRPETLGSLEEAGAKALKLDVTSSADELKTFASEALSF